MLNMKTAKFSNIILFITAIVMFFCAVMCNLGAMSVSADSLVTPKNYFTFTGDEKTFDYVANFDSDYLVNEQVVESGVAVSALKDQVLSLKNQVAVDDLGIKIICSTAIKNFTVSMRASSYDVNFKDGDDKSTAELSNMVTINYLVEVPSDGIVDLQFAVNEDSLITVKEDGSMTPIETDAYYKVRHVDKTPINLSFKIGEVEGDAPANFVITAINQKASAGYVTDKESDEYNMFNQTFELNEAKNGLANIAIPRVALKDNFWTNTMAEGYKLRKIDGALYTVEISAYNVTSLIPTGNLYLLAGDMDDNGYSVNISTEKSAKRVIFNLKEGKMDSNMSFHVATKIDGEDVIAETFDVYVQSEENVENKAPEYRPYEEVKSEVENFQKALDLATQNNGVSINLGGKITIPSLENFITDDFSSYKSMTKTYHLVTPTKADQSSTSSVITLDEVGEYLLYVTFKDENGASMDKEDFYSTDPDAELKYEKFVFTLTINDDADLIVSAESNQDDGYTKIKYKAAPFDIKATGYNTKYSLYYNPNKYCKDVNASGWVRIYTVKEFNSSVQSAYTAEELVLTELTAMYLLTSHIEKVMLLHLLQLLMTQFMLSLLVIG